MLRFSFLKAIIGDMVQHLDRPVGGYAGRSSLLPRLRQWLLVEGEQLGLLNKAVPETMFLMFRHTLVGADALVGFNVRYLLRASLLNLAQPMAAHSD